VLTVSGSAVACDASSVKVSSATVKVAASGPCEVAGAVIKLN
jgi:hypothetical protein